MAEELKNNRVIKVILGLVVAGLVGGMLWLWVFNYKTLVEVSKIDDKVIQRQSENVRYYMGEYRETKAELDETNVRLAEVTQELEAANVELTSARGELGVVQGMNDQLKEHIVSLERYKAAAMAKGEALETMISAFKKKNRELDKNLQAARKELAVFQPDINDLNEGRSKVQLFKNHIRLVKKNMKGIRLQADALREAAQKERDRLESLYGNAGFMVKDGQNTALPQIDQKNIEIDVKFVN